MSLFPAYSGELPDASTSSTQSVSAEADWLSNPSFIPNKDETVTTLSSSSSGSSSDLEIVHSQLKRSKKVRSRRPKKKVKRKDEKKGSRVVAEKKIASGISDKWSFKGNAQILQDNSDLVFDKFYDVENLQFGGLYKKHLAKFRYPPAPLACLGGTQKLNKLLKLGLSDKIIKLDHSKGRYFAKKVKKMIENSKNERVGGGSDTKKFDFLCGDEIEIVEPEMTEMDGEGVTHKYVYDSTTRMYKEIDLTDTYEGLPQTQTDSERRANALNKIVNTEPTNITAWMQLIDLQDHLYRQRQSKKVVGGPVSDLNVLDRKISIVEKAISKNTGNVQLHLSRLDFARDVWEKEKLREEWRKLEFAFVNNMQMWRGLFHYVQTGFAGFSVGRMVQVYDRCISKIQEVMKGKLLSHQPLPGTESFLLEVICRKVIFLSQAGHTEKAIAIIQALIEFNLFAPVEIQEMSLEHRRRFFEPFWDSGAPRIGESGAKGWKVTMAEKTRVSNIEQGSDLSSLEDNIFKDSPSASEGALWVALETLRNKQMCLPNRTNLEAEDVETMVLFDDIQSSLITFQPEILRFDMICFFLEFLGGHLLPRNTKRLIEEDYMTQFPLLPNLDRDPVKSNTSILEAAFQSLVDVFDNDMGMYLKGSILFDRAFRIANDGGLSHKLKLKNYKKFAKELLGLPDNRHSSVLYFVYAAQLKALDPQNKEYASICQMTYDQLNSVDLPLSIRLQILICQSTSTPESSLQLIHNFVDGHGNNSQVTPASIIKTRKYLEEKIAKCCASVPVASSGVHDFMGPPKLLLTCLLSEFLFAASNFKDLQASLNVLREHNFEEVLLNPCSRLILCDQRLDLLHRFKEHNWLCPPVLVDAVLNECIDLCPDNATVLRRYIDAQLDSQLMVDLRRNLEGRLNKITSPTAKQLMCIAILYAEFARYIKLMNYSIEEYCQPPETHKMINVLERAVQTHPTFPLLWLLYFKFEQLRGKASNVKQLLYRAIRACPSCKQLYVQVVGSCPDTVQVITDLMIEKDIRLRVPLEELQLLIKGAKQKNEMIDESPLNDHVNIE